MREIAPLDEQKKSNRTSRRPERRETRKFRMTS
jgi:hypothetical protein